MNSHAVHAHLVMVHNNPDQFTRLVCAANHPENLFVLHVDVKSAPAVHQAAAALAARFENVSILPPRDVRWASWSVIETTLAAIKQLLDANKTWRHFSNLSGQDFPLRPQEAILSRLKAAPESNYIEYFDPLIEWIDGADRIRYVRLELPGMKAGLNLPKLRWDRWQRYLGKTRFYGGSSYFTLSRAFCEHMLASPNMPAFRKFFRHTFATDEMFIQSFIMDSPFRDTLVNNDMRLIDFSEGTPRPRTWTCEHSQILLDSDDFYARKFDPAVDDEIIALLEQRSVLA